MNMSNILLLNASIFDIDTITKEKKAYFELAKIEVIGPEGCYYKCFFYEPVYPLNITINEFENYVIGLMGKNDY